jgi:hypothetical protein
MKILEVFSIWKNGIFSKLNKYKPTFQVLMMEYSIWPHSAGSDAFLLVRKAGLLSDK